MQSGIINRLQHVTPFDSLPQTSLAELRNQAILHTLAAGDRIIEDDTLNPTPPVYVILTGRVRLVESEQQMTVRHLQANEVFGHFAMLRRLPPPYHADISQAAEILEIQNVALQALFARHPVFAAWFQVDLRRSERELWAFDDVASRQDKPPASLAWCWLSPGSEGRGEMVLRIDQDNAIIYESATPELADAWLARLAEDVNSMLNTAGISSCEAGIMASNASMRHDLAGWSIAIQDWMSDADENRLLWISVLTDCRPIYGTGRLCGELKTELATLVLERRHFLAVLAHEALVPALPLRHFPSLRLKGYNTEHGEALNLKLHGTHLITHAARLFCLDRGWLDQTGISERLAWLLDNDDTLHDTAHEGIVAYGLLADLRLSWHVEQANRGETLSDFIPMDSVGDTRSRLLIGAYQTIEDIRQRIKTQFNISY